MWHHAFLARRTGDDYGLMLEWITQLITFLQQLNQSLISGGVDTVIASGKRDPCAGTSGIFCPAYVLVVEGLFLLSLLCLSQGVAALVFLWKSWLVEPHRKESQLNFFLFSFYSLLHLASTNMLVSGIKNRCSATSLLFPRNFKIQNPK